MFQFVGHCMQVLVSYLLRFQIVLYPIEFFHTAELENYFYSYPVIQLFIKLDLIVSVGCKSLENSSL